MKQWIKTLLKPKVYSRKLDIDTVSEEKSKLISKVDYILNNYGDLNDQQRMQVLKQVIDNNRERLRNKMIVIQSDYDKTELVLDEIQGITLNKT